MTYFNLRMGGVVLSPCRLAWGSPVLEFAVSMVGYRLCGRGNGHLLQEDLGQHPEPPRTAVARAPDPVVATVDPCLCGRLPNTHRQVWLSLLWGHCSFLLGPIVHKVLSVPSKFLFPQSYGNSVIKSHWPSKSDSLRIPSPFAKDPQVGKAVLGPRTFITVQELLWYNCSPVCGSPTSSSQFSSVQSLSCVQLSVTPWTAARQASPSITSSRSLLKLMSIELGMPSNHLILCYPLLLLPSIFPSIRVFSKESALCIRWPKYCSFSFSISPSSEYSGLISFKIDCFDLFEVQGTLKSPLQNHSSKTSILQCSAFFIVQLSHPYMTTVKNNFDYPDLCWQSNKDGRVMVESSDKI